MPDTEHKDGSYTITLGFTARDLCWAILAGFIAGFCLAVGVVAYVGVGRFVG